MKTIKLNSAASAKAYLGPVEKSHTPEELDELYACIRYTKMFKQNESNAKMEEIGLLERPLPDIGRFIH